MSKPKISIIVAIYNVERYLAKCIESILNQTYRDIEVILVNDGTKDNSLAICEDYAFRDNRVVVLSKENGGQSTARNKGLDIAQGDYIGFVDGDDWIEANMYESLLSVMEKENADIIQCGWYKVETDGTKACPFKEPFKELYTSKQGLDELIESNGGHLNTSVCCKLFKRDIALKYRFSPVRAYEDDEYIFKSVSEATRILCIDTPYYNYLNREGSTMTAHFNLNKIALVTIQDNICKLIRARYPKRFPEVQKTLCSKQLYILHCLLSNPNVDPNGEATISLQRSIKESYAEYMRNPRMGKNRIMLVLMKIFPKMIWRRVLAMKFSGAPR